MSTEASPREAIGLVTRREFTQRVRSKVFGISTALMVVAVIATALILNAVSGQTSSVHVGLVPQSAASAAALQATGDALGQKISTQVVPDVATGQQRLRDDDLDALVVQTGGTVQVVVKKQIDDGLKATLTVLSRQLAQDSAVAAAGGDPATVNAAISGAQVQVTALEPATKYQAERVVLGLAAGILVYLALMVYGQTVAQGVVEEKTSRVVELLLATVRPWQLMLGKVAGIGAAGLVQMTLVVGAGIGAGLATGALTMPSSLALSTAVWAVVWFIVGFLMYALLFAAAGALVSRQEDVGGVTAPILMLIIVPYVIGISVLPADPTNQLVKILSLIPFFSPTLMPVRIALGVAAPWEIALSLVLSVGLTVSLVGITGRIYANSVMRTGARVRIGDALRPL
ncbi:ABC transporter permease [Angustibacter sp. McL0619]|uniref:ABC transporter permease n=1 Tax=Angustibacter sp. McL0619 TaxID=3415676 RepID=UPI003CE70099